MPPAFSSTADVDDVVGDCSEPDPAVHSDEVLVATTGEAVSSLYRADSTR